MSWSIRTAGNLDILRPEFMEGYLFWHLEGRRCQCSSDYRCCLRGGVPVLRCRHPAKGTGRASREGECRRTFPCSRSYNQPNEYRTHVAALNIVDQLPTKHLAYTPHKSLWFDHVDFLLQDLEEKTAELLNILLDLCILFGPAKRTDEFFGRN